MKTREKIQEKIDKLDKKINTMMEVYWDQIDDMSIENQIEWRKQTDLMRRQKGMLEWVLK